MLPLTLLPLVLQDPSPATKDWITVDPGCTAIACADLNRDGYDDLLATDNQGRLFASYNLAGEGAGEWKLLNKHAPTDVVGIGVVATDRHAMNRPGGSQGMLVTGTRLLVGSVSDLGAEWREHTWRLTRLGGSDSEGTPLPNVPLRVIEAYAVDGLLWVHTPEKEWWRLRTAGSYFDGPYPDPRPALLPVSPPPSKSREGEPDPPRWRCWGDLNGDGAQDTLAVFPVREPPERLIVRVVLAAKPKK